MNDKTNLARQVSLTRQVRLLPSLALDKQQMNLAYLMELKTENLLLPYYFESGLSGSINQKKTDIHWGWDGPFSHIRGTFTGHWLSAAARLVDQTADNQLKSKADFIVNEIGRCQVQNGGGWAFPIPEKYLYALKNGKHFWAPHYVCHKVMMGLLDMAVFTGNSRALEILDGCTSWFMRFTDDISRDQMNDMMDLEETGGMMEFWADLHAITGSEMHRELMRRYERPRLTEPLLAGQDVLTNMHANSTIPEIHGCARAYEVTGDERYRRIVESYWHQAVTLRGTYATGGQTSGEVWTARDRLSARLGKLNQEHCTVYNMIRLADYLYRWTGDSVYADYIEMNILNGLFAQGFWTGSQIGQCGEAEPDPGSGCSCAANRTDCCACTGASEQVCKHGLIAYYLPLAAGSKKVWGSRTEDFWCCHCTLVQANSRYREFIFYQDAEQSPDPVLTIAQYMPASVNLTIDSHTVRVELTAVDLGGSSSRVNEIAGRYANRPDFDGYHLRIRTDQPVQLTLRFRLPGWMKEPVRIYVGSDNIETVSDPPFFGRQVDKPLPEQTDTAYQVENGFAVLTGSWKDSVLTILLPKQLTCLSLPDEPDTVAFLDGPVLLVGLVDEERTLRGDPMQPASLIKPHDERWWSVWNRTWRTVNQDVGFTLRPLYEIGYERYTVYFPVRRE